MVYYLEKGDLSMKIEKSLRAGLPQVGVPPYGQIHAHSTGNPTSTVQNEVDYHGRRPVNSGFVSHFVGNGRVVQTARLNAGFYDVGGGWNAWGYAAIELIESHRTREEFMIDYKLYVELIRQLCDEAGLPKTLDQGNTGVISHAYATAHQPNNNSDHVDPYPYLAKWGISKAQFAKDIANGFGNDTSTTQNKPKPQEIKKGAKAMFVYTYVRKDGVAELWGVNGNARFHFKTMEQYNHFLKIVKANGGDTTTSNKYKEGTPIMKLIEAMAPNVTSM